MEEERGASGGPRLIVRNTFLDFYDEAEHDDEAVQMPRRPRAQTDITDSKLPQKVTYHGVDYSSIGGPGAWASPSSGGFGNLGGLPEDMGTLPGPWGGLPSSTFAAGGLPLGPLPPFGFPPPGAWSPWGFPGGPGTPGAMPPPAFPAFPPGPWSYPPAPYAAGAGRAAPNGNRAARQKGGKKEKGGGRGSRGEESAMAEMQNAGGSGSGKGGNRGGGNARGVPAQAPAAAAVAPAAPTGPANPDTATTVMLRNIPNRYTADMMLELLDEHGFKYLYDFVYLPMDFRNGVNLGYAFVNILTHKDALRFMDKFQGFANWFFDSAKVCEVSWAHPHQGIDEHVERYRNSPVMHPSMPEEYKPMIFCNGERIEFPPPTKAIRAPKLRPSHDRPAQEKEGA
mmetsp:Transcript_52030/g.111355  ORF Transcript_52030/g.111355 Transcript_52030/m.111355 type:complete len:396 (-) Transcript_52030:97-1284(-)